MNYFYKLLLLIISIPVVLLFYANTNGSPGGRTGSPGDGNQTCTSCHSGTAINQAGWISTNIPSGGYTPGNTYQITLNSTHAGAARFGFELTAETSTGQKTGTFAITESNRTKLVNQSKAVTHTTNGTTASGGVTSWTMNWTAPPQAAGNITFYAAVNAANGNGGTSGDIIYRTTLSVQPMAPAALVSVQPSTAAQGQTVTLTITGTNTSWTGTTPTVQLALASNPNQTINATMVTVNTSNQLQAEFTIPSGAIVGVYHVRVNDLQLSNAFTITAVTLVAEAGENVFSVFPNPSSGAALVISHQLQNPLLRVFDLNGRLVFTQQLGVAKELLNLGNLPKGVYTLLLSDEKHTRSQKLILR
ncbi:MAG TPA: T9SS type A sorting domain-containing protein [Bacteroidales bacterium]|nr:T9SS type A sorting domain-containing protein [Bacteroidales bacterium]